MKTRWLLKNEAWPAAKGSLLVNRNVCPANARIWAGCNDGGMAITYHIGDATAPDGRGPGVIAHVCNDSGGWGKGFVLAVSRRWPEPEAAYRRWARSAQAGSRRERPSTCRASAAGSPEGTGTRSNRFSKNTSPWPGSMSGCTTCPRRNARPRNCPKSRKRERGVGLRGQDGRGTLTDQRHESEKDVAAQALSTYHLDRI